MRANSTNSLLLLLSYLKFPILISSFYESEGVLDLRIIWSQNKTKNGSFFWGWFWETGGLLGQINGKMWRAFSVDLAAISAVVVFCPLEDLVLRSSCCPFVCFLANNGRCCSMFSSSFLPLAMPIWQNGKRRIRKRYNFLQALSSCPLKFGPVKGKIFRFFRL